MQWLKNSGKGKSLEHNQKSEIVCVCVKVKTGVREREIERRTLMCEVNKCASMRCDLMGWMFDGWDRGV